MRQRDVDRFWSKVNVGGHDECWEWTGTRDRDGYGIFRLGRKNVKAHRVAFGLPTGGFVLHRCDSPACVNPGHLYLGDHSQNMTDRQERGRTCRGEISHLSVLTEEDVLEIRSSDDPQKVLGERFGVTPNQIGNIRRRECWKHLP